MRLTLRTLLAYLDDTLPAEQARMIGEKVAESDVAQELIEKIKHATRRRKLAAPPLESDEENSDANVISEYLDNLLPADQLEDVEKTAFASEAHLAELAACHQILTLVLGEPATVPGPARQRMYRIVKGKESNPDRKPRVELTAGVVAPEVPEDIEEADPVLLLGMPRFSRKSTLKRRLIPLLTITGLAIVLLVAVILTLPQSNQPDSRLFVFRDTPRSGVPAIPESKTESNETEVASETLTVPPREAKAKEEKEPVGPAVKKQPLVQLMAPPSIVRQAIATMEGKDSFLLAKSPINDSWQAVDKIANVIQSTDSIQTLPASKGEILTESGIHVLLLGNYPDWLDLSYFETRLRPYPQAKSKDDAILLESRIKLFQPPANFDAELELEQGRIYLTNKKQPPGPMQIRLRIRSETWDLTLDGENAEVGIELTSQFPEGVPFVLGAGGESPRIRAEFALLQGKASLKAGYKSIPGMVAPIQLSWDSQGAGVSAPETISPNGLEYWRKGPKLKSGNNEQIEKVAAEFHRRLSVRDARPEVVFFSSIKNDQKALRVYAAYGLQSVDSARDLVDLLNNENAGSEVYDAAIESLRHWIGMDPNHEKKLHKELIDRKIFTEKESTEFIGLLHTYSHDLIKDRPTIDSLFDLMKNDSLKLRNLGAWHLSRMDPVGSREVSGFNPTAEQSVRDSSISRWEGSWRRRNPEKK
jgi:hypothetical protein